VVTLKAAYLDSLAVGDYSITIPFGDGTTVTHQFKVEKAASASAPALPQTGDEAPLTLVLIPAFAALGTTCLLARRKLSKKAPLK
jgi:LPXTG-motif cell wall-anchored protein